MIYIGQLKKRRQKNGPFYILDANPHLSSSFQYETSRNTKKESDKKKAECVVPIA
jgi:hypothetical protein